MEGLFACLRGKLAWRRRASSEDFRRHLGPGSSLPAGGQLACWEAVKGKSVVRDEGRGHGGAAHGGGDGSPSPPPTGTPTLSSAVTDNCCVPVPPQAPIPPASKEAALEGLEKKEKSFIYSRHVSFSKTKQDIEEPEVALLKFKGIPRTDSFILEESKINVGTTTAALHFEEDTGENGVALLLNVKGISSPDPLCDCVASTKRDGNAYANKDGHAVQTVNVVKKSLTQLFVKVCQKEVSMQEDFNTTTIKELIDSACHKAGIKSCDFYATYGGKPLEANKPIAYYSIFRDSTIHLRSRLRAGREYGSVTFEALMMANMGNRFHQVKLSALSQNMDTKHSSVTFLSEFSAYYIHRIMIYICGIHREGRSCDGKFTAKDILIVNKTMVVFDTNVPDNYVFSESTCGNDYMALYQIFGAYFTESGNITAKYFEHFLNYLLECPAKGNSNSEPLMKFITNHPALTSYMDRIKQCILLDSMVRRLNANDLTPLDHGGILDTWAAEARKVPALAKVYLFDSLFDKKIHTRIVINVEYTGHYLGCLRFARNYFSHADYQMILPEVNAAFAEGLKNFLPSILMKVAYRYTLPADFDKLTLLGNPLSDSSELLSISYPTASQMEIDQTTSS